MVPQTKFTNSIYLVLPNPNRSRDDEWVGGLNHLEDFVLINTAVSIPR